jgi:dCMP deaminase
MTTNDRLSWPEVWMEFAHLISQRSYDDKLKVGAVIVSVDNSTVLSLGYNGNARGLPNVRDSLEPGKSGFIHAEMNALLKLNFRDPAEKILYVTHSPCPDCCKAVIQSNINHVIYDKEFRDMSGLDYLRQSGIGVSNYVSAARYLASQKIAH